MPSDPGTGNCKGYAFIQVSLSKLWYDFQNDSRAVFACTAGFSRYYKIHVRKETLMALCTSVLRILLWLLD